MPHTSQEEAIDEGSGVAPLSELTVQQPIARDEPGEEEQPQPQPQRPTQQQRDDVEDEEEEEKEDDDNFPLSEITSEIPIERRRAEPSSPSTLPGTAAAAAGPSSTADHPPISAWATRLYTISYLIFFAIFGTLARLGLQALTSYPGAPVITGVLWANASGCILMGFFIEDRNIFREEWGHAAHHHHRRSTSTSRRASISTVEKEQQSKSHKTVKKTIPLYIGLTTGFCGSFTSFSSFMRDAFLALGNDLADPSVSASASSSGSGGGVSNGVITGRNKGDSFMAVVAVLAVTMSMSIAAFYLGAHLALALDPLTPTVPFRFTRNVLDRVVVVLGWGCWLGAVLMSIWPPQNAWRGDALFAIVFAPLGCLFRFYMSLWLNARIPVFSLGTFAVNIIGTGILGMCYVLQHISGIGALSATSTLWAVDPLVSPSSRSSLFPGISDAEISSLRSLLVSCQVLQGVMDGFCGATTTVSTWIAEITSIGLGKSRGRRFAWAYLYAIVSMAIGLALLIVVMGSVQWSRGFDLPYC